MTPDRLAGGTPFWDTFGSVRPGGADDVDGPALSVQVQRPERSTFDRHRERSYIMRQIARIGLDIAKRWFQLHAVDETGK